MIFEVLKSLLPDGLAFRLLPGKMMRNLMEAFAEEPDRIKAFIDDVRDAGVPGRIPDDALSDWETFLNINRGTLTASERQDQIVSRYTAVGGQGPEYIEDVLESAGFAPTKVLYVTENTSDQPNNYLAALGNFEFGEEQIGEFTNRIDPRTLNGFLIAGPPQFETQQNYIASLGGFNLGQYNLGQFSGTGVVEVQPSLPADPDRFIFIWFITGPTGVGDFVNLNESDRERFFSLVRILKPAHTWVIAQATFS